MPTRFSGVARPRGRRAKSGKKNVKRAAKQFRRAAARAKRGGAGAFIKKLDAAKRVKRARANARRAAKPGSMAKLKSYRTNLANPRPGTLPIGYQQDKTVVRMRRVIRLDVSNYNRGEGSTPSLIFNLNDPLAPDLIYGDGALGGSAGDHDDAVLAVVNRQMSAAEGYDSANARFKKGIVLRSKVTCEWLRRPMAHIQEAQNTTSSLVTNDGHGFARFNPDRHYRSEQLLMAGTAGRDGELGRLQPFDRVKYDSMVSYEPSPPAYLITQVGKTNTQYGYPISEGISPEGNWGMVNPPYLQQPPNTAIDSTVAMLQRSRDKKNQLKFRLVPEARREQRHVVQYLYERSKHHKLSAHAALRMLDKNADDPDDVDEPTDAFFFENATHNIDVKQLSYLYDTAPLNDFPVTGLNRTTMQIKAIAGQAAQHPAATSTFRIQMLPEDTAPHVRQRTSGTDPVQLFQDKVTEDKDDDTFNDTYPGNAASGGHSFGAEYMGAIRPSGPGHPAVTHVVDEQADSTVRNLSVAFKGQRIRPITMADVPAAKALGAGQVTVTIDYIVLCTDPWTSSELEIAQEEGEFRTEMELDEQDVTGTKHHSGPGEFRSVMDPDFDETKLSAGKRRRVDKPDQRAVEDEVLTQAGPTPFRQGVVPSHNLNPSVEATGSTVTEGGAGPPA